MKVKRKKVVSRVLLFFQKNFGFREPYQVLVDGTFCLAALQAKVNLLHQIPLYLGPTKLLTTVCAVKETEDLVGYDLYGAMLIIKQYAIHRCGHEKNPLSARDCLLSMIDSRNENHYIIASQDNDLRLQARLVAGTPILYINHDTPVMEKPSTRSVKIGDKIVKKRLLLTQTEKKVLRTLKREFDLTKPDAPARKKRKIRGQNPLSCLKKKRKRVPKETAKQESPTSEVKRKRKRVRVKIAKHVKEHLATSGSGDVSKQVL